MIGRPPATSDPRGGFGRIPRKRVTRILPSVAVVLLLLALAGSAAAARPKASDYPPPQLAPAQQAGPKPHLMLLHGGSFLYDDPEFVATTDEAARRAGFIPHYTKYPLGDMPAAVLAVRAEARRLRLKVGLDMVYAYGSSAGGTLAALLAGDGLVGAAAAKAPVSNLVEWDWPLFAYGPRYWERVRLDLPARYRLSPLRRPVKHPLLLVHGINDQVVPIAQSEAYAAKFRRVHLWETLGGHRAERVLPEVLQGSLLWLAETAEARAQGTLPR